MILRDRNHPSVTIWGLLNETKDGPVFRHAVKALDLVRELDQTRLVILNSGRWDAQPMIGSVSNPGSRVWECQWGLEGKKIKPVPIPPDKNPQVGGFQGAGDAHVYPRVPQTADSNAFIRHLGHGHKPVFLSEYGVGPLKNVVDDYRKFEETGCRLDVPDSTLIKSMADQFEAAWKRLGFDGLYPFAEDMLRDSERLNMRQRRLGLDLVRSNPNLCGFAGFGLSDDAGTGGGSWTFWREWKSGIADVLRDGWAPLRWCLFVTPSHGYAGRPVELEAVLANEGVLMPGRYPVKFRITGPNGLVWEKRVHAIIPKFKDDRHGPLAIPVLKTKVILDGPSGEYKFAAHLEKGGAPAGDRMSFRLTRESELTRLNDEVTVWGVDRKVVRWLETHGVRCRPFQNAPAHQPKVILVGQPFDVTRSAWLNLLSRVAQGGSAVFLKPQVFRCGDDNMFWMPLSKKGQCTFFNDWVYHKECVAQRHPVFSGLQAGGILDWDYYDQIISHEIFQGQDAPDETICAAFAAGYNSGAAKDEGYVSGIMMGRYALGAGCFVLNTLNILDYVDGHPAADRLLLNLVAYAWGCTRKKTAVMSDTLEKRLQSFFVDPPNATSDWQRQWNIAQQPDMKVEDIAQVPHPESLNLNWQKADSGLLQEGFMNLLNFFGASGGMSFASANISVSKDMDAVLLLGSDGPCKIWIDREPAGLVPSAGNPAEKDKYRFPIRITRGKHTIWVALNRRGGAAWGFFLRFMSTDKCFTSRAIKMNVPFKRC